MNNLFVDFDSTIAQSIEAYCITYSVLYGHIEGYKEPNPNNIRRWDLQDECPLCDNPERIFSDPIFFNNLKPFPKAVEILEKLSKSYNIIICSIGSYDNISLKAQWIKKNLPFIKNAILINNDDVMNKSIVNMEGAIFIDDHADNLRSSNADIRIRFGKIYPWNEDWKGIWVNNWDELVYLLSLR